MPLIFRTVSFVILLLFCISNARSQSCPITVTTALDLTICEPQCVDLMGTIVGNYLDFEWTNTEGYFNNADLNPCAMVNGNTTFTLSATSVNNTNLIVNGDFEAGDVGFTTDYTLGITIPNCYGAGYLDCEGTYGIETNPNDGHTGFDNCGDHTSGSGNMMVVNGAAGLQDVWCQNITVTPNTDYLFSAWVASVNSSSPAILRFSIDGVLIGTDFNASSSTCFWQEFFAEWNSGASSNIQICVTNQNFATGGNDFAIDDISFYEVCEVQASFDVMIQSPTVVLQEQHNHLNCNQWETTITSSITPMGTHSYNWYTFDGNIVGSSMGANIDVNQGGTYYLEVTDTNGCTNESSVFITQDFEAPILSPQDHEVLNCVQLESLLSVYITYFGIGQVTMEWFDENNTSLVDFDNELTATAPGIYTFTVTGDNGCSSSIDIEVEQDITIPDVALQQIGELDCNNGLVEIISSSNSNILAYYWSNGDQTPNIEVQLPDTYQLIVTANNGCSNEASIEIENEDIAFSFSLSDSLLDCTLAAFQLDPQINGNYSNLTWTLPDQSTQQDEIIDISTNGIYILEVSDQNNCTLIDTMEIMIDTLAPNYLVTIDSISCSSGGSININTADTNQIQWSINGTIVDDSTTVQSNTVTDAHLTLISDNGCITMDTLSFVSNESVPEFSLQSNNIDCITSEATVIVNSNENLNYQWEGPNNFNSIQNQFTTTTPGQYLITITDGQDCAILDTINISIDTLSPETNVLISNPLTCIQATAILTNTLYDPLLDYQWYDSNGILGNGISLLINNDQHYYLQATSSNNCSSIDSFQINWDTLAPSLEILLDTIDCINTQADFEILTPNSVIDYTWTVANTTTSGTMLNISEGGMAQVIAYNPNNGCSSSQEFEIQIDTLAPPLEIQVQSINCIQTLGNVAIINPQSNLEYSWLDNGNLNPIANGNLSFSDATISQIEVYSPDNGCTTYEEFQILVDTLSPPLDYTFNEINCLDLVSNLNVTNPDPSYVYEWQIGNETIALTTTSTDYTGNINLSVVNPQNGCTESSNFMIAIDTIHPALELSIEQINCFNESAQISITDDWEAYSIAWQQNENSLAIDVGNFTSSVAGDYELLVENPINHCQSIFPFVIDPYEALSANVSNINPSCLIPMGSIEIENITGGSPPYFWSLDEGQSFETDTVINNLEVGPYQILILDQDECEISLEIELEDFIPLSVDLIDTIEIEIGTSLNVNPAFNINEAEIAEFFWSPEDVLSCSDCWNPNYLLNSDTTLSLTVIDINGCQDIAYLFVDLPSEVFIYVPNIFSPYNSDGPNDRFFPFANPNTVEEIEAMRIFDRWGEEVFSQEHFPIGESEFGWDGRFKNKKVQPGVFVYVAHVRLLTGELITLRGDITLVD